MMKIPIYIIDLLIINIIIIIIIIITIIIIIIYNYGLHEKLITLIIKLRKGYFPEVRRTEGK